MAIEKTYLLGKNITLGCGFDLQAKSPLDSRQVVPEYAGLQALIDGNAAYEGMIVYDEETKKTYQAQLVDGVLAFREFGINEAELRDLIASETTAAMEFKGVTATLPENPAKGDMWKVAGENISIKIDDVDAKIGDAIVYNGEQWFLIPSGDDIEDTWRPVTDVANDATLTFAAGDKIDVAVASNGTVTYSHEAIDAPVDITADGDERTRTYITAVETDGFGHITGYKTATENVEDTNTTYTFEGQSEDATSVYFQVTSSEEGASAEVVYLDAYSKNEADAELAKKVDKVEGKSLISDSEIARLADVHNYDDTQVKADIAKKADAEAMTTELGKKVDKVEGYSLVSDAEIARLADVDNYDDAEVRGLISDNADAIAAEAEAARAAEGALSGRIDTLEKIDHDAYVGADTALKNELNGEIAKKADASVVTAMDEAYKAADTGLSNRIKDLEDNKAGYATTGEVATAKSEAISDAAADATNKANAAEKNAKDYADGLNTAMNERVEALEAIDHEHANQGVLDGITAEKVAAWDAAEQNAIAKANELNGAMDTRMQVVEGKAAALEAKVDTGDKKVSEAIADAIADAKTDASNKDAVVLSEAQKGIAAVQANLDDHVDNTDIHVTAEQKNVWNAAVQTVTAGADSGLKATKTGTDVAIEIDDSIVWVFDCGGSGVVTE